MPNRRTTYQRRHIQRRSERIFALSFFATCCLSGVLYLIFRSQIMTAVYQEILATSQPHHKTVDSVLFWHLVNYLPVCFIVLFVFIILFSLRLSIPHDNFDFGETESLTIRPAFPEEHRRQNLNLYRLSSRQFEEQVARLITMQTGYRAIVIGGSGDRGADIEVYDSRNRRIGVVQCKKHDPHKALDPGYVREMPSVRQLYQVNIVYLATTAYFSDATRRDADELGVRLIDGHDLKQISRKVSSGKPQKKSLSLSTPSQRYPPAPPNDSHTAFRPPTSVPPPSNDPHAPFRPPASTEEARIQAQLRQRRDQLQKR